MKIAPRLLETVVFGNEFEDDREPPSMTEFVDFVSMSRWLMLRELIRSDRTQQEMRQGLGWSANRIWQILFGKKFDPTVSEVREWFFVINPDIDLKFRITF